MPGPETVIPFAAGPWGTLIGAGLGLFGSLFGAHKQSDAAKQASQASVDAARVSADQQNLSDYRALQFQQAMAANAFANSEASRRGNYDQWAARERRLGSIGEVLGWGGRDIPGYVPGVAPSFDGTAATGTRLGPAGAYLSPAIVPAAPVTPALKMPDPYRVGSVGSYF